MHVNFGIPDKDSDFTYTHDIKEKFQHSDKSYDTVITYIRAQSNLTKVRPLFTLSHRSDFSQIDHNSLKENYRALVILHTSTTSPLLANY